MVCFPNGPKKGLKNGQKIVQKIVQSTFYPMSYPQQTMIPTKYNDTNYYFSWIKTREHSYGLRENLILFLFPVIVFVTFVLFDPELRSILTNE